MKKILLMVVLIIFSAGALFAQAPQQAQKAMVKDLKALYAQKDPNKRLDAIKEFAEKYPEAPVQVMKYYYNIYFKTLIQKRDYDGAKGILDDYLKYMSSPEPISMAQLYNELAYTFSQTSKYVDLAFSYAKKAKEELAKVKNIPQGMTASEWKEKRAYFEASINDTLGYLYYKKNDVKNAKKYLEEAVKVVQYDDTIRMHLGLAYERANEYKLAYKQFLYAKYLNDGNVSPELDNAIKRVEKKAFSGWTKTAFEKKVKAEVDNMLKKKALKDEINKKAFNFTLKDLKGNDVKLSDFKGKVVLLDFWATWCPPCRMEMPVLQAISNEYKNKNVVVIGVSVDNARTVNNVPSFIEKRGITFKILYDDKTTSDKYGVSGIPSLFVIDKNGNISFHHTGYSTFLSKELHYQIDYLLGK